MIALSLLLAVPLVLALPAVPLVASMRPGTPGAAGRVLLGAELRDMAGTRSLRAAEVKDGRGGGEGDGKAGGTEHDS